MKMKKLTLILLFSSIIGIANAQKSSFRFGLKATPTLAWLKPDAKGLAADGSKLTFSWGFLAEYYFADNYAFATGVDIVGRGGKFTENDTAHLTYNVKYLEIPLTIKMRTNEIGYMRYFGQFGFTPGINIQAKKDYESVGSNQDDIDIKGTINDFNIGLAIGLGFEYSFGGNTALVVSAVFNNGFTDIDKSSHLDGAGNVIGNKLISNFVGLNVGVLF